MYCNVPQVSPEEYKEFLGLGHGEIFNLDLDSVVDAPWRWGAAFLSRSLPAVLPT
jgi:hypothetical protein